MPFSNDSVWYSIGDIAQSSEAFKRLPIVYPDNEYSPQCLVTVTLDGNSEIRSMFPTTPTIVKELAAELILHCVIPENKGGWRTYGLERTINMMLETPMDSTGKRIGPFEIPVGGYGKRESIVISLNQRFEQMIKSQRLTLTNPKHEQN